MNESKNLIELRISDASTVDNDMSSDDDIYNEIKSTSQLDPSQILQLFLPISDSFQLMYDDLEAKLKDIYYFLELEIEPICVRDEKCISSNSVNLCSTGRSRIYQRRSTLTLS